MKIFSSFQIKALDQYTIENEPIDSIELMERASLAFCHWFMSRFEGDKTIAVFAGTGNNGGDGLAIARILHREGYSIEVLIVGDTTRGSEDFKKNLSKLPFEISKHSVEASENFPLIIEKDIVIDAIFGSGLNRPVAGIYKTAIALINSSKAVKVAVDVPSGLFCEKINNRNDAVVKADFSLTFQLPKLCFFLPENEEWVGEWSVADIGLSSKFIEEEKSNYEFILRDYIEEKIKRRGKFSHKGTFGHALILAGSYGKIGAALLSAQACLRTGVGLLTLQVSACGYNIVQTAVPEAMCLTDESEKELSQLFNISRYNAIGIGPGIGKATATKKLLEELLSNAQQPLVLDADALNIIAENPDLLQMLPAQSVLTPHPKEFERLAGKSANSIQRLDLLKEFCVKNRCVVVLKGAYTATCNVDGKIYFNSTGNPGMATGGSGDVLTGIITSLLAQQYPPLEAAIFGVFLHGFAGDIAAEKLGYPSLIASDITDNIHRFFLEFLQH